MTGPLKERLAFVALELERTRTKAVSASRRKEIARRAAQARWGKKSRKM